MTRDCGPYPLFFSSPDTWKRLDSALRAQDPWPGDSERIVMLNIFFPFRWQDILDILIVYFLIYRAILLIRGTRAIQMAGGLAVLTVIYFVARELNLLTLLWLLRTVFSSILLITIIVFQHDIRRALIQVGRTPFQKVHEMAADELDEIIKAVTYMARRRIGALIVIERQTGLKDYVETGHIIDARLSRELLVSIFLASSPLQDGAVIISKGRLWTRRLASFPWSATP